MKKITLFSFFIISGITFGQLNTETENPEFPQDIEKKHELKINALTLLVAKWIDVSYETLIDQESSFGVATTLNTDTSYTDLKYSLSPYYRRYFSNKFARGFFVEGFGMLFSAKDTDLFGFGSQEFKTGFAMGVSAELLLGVGRNFNDSTYNEGIARIGISIGHRF
jgi:hypothetical protein